MNQLEKLFEEIEEMIHSISWKAEFLAHSNDTDNIDNEEDLRTLKNNLRKLVKENNLI